MGSRVATRHSTQQPEPAPYAWAMALTTRALEARARHYRNQVVVVSLVGLSSCLLALVLRSPYPVLANGALIPLCAGFAVLDSWLCRRWQSELLFVWVQRRLDFVAFRRTIEPARYLPQSILRPMLELLPASEDLAAEQRITAASRRAIANSIAGEARGNLVMLLCRSVSWSLAGAAVVASVWQHSIGPLPWLVVVALPMLAQRPVRRLCARYGAGAAPIAGLTH